MIVKPLPEGLRQSLAEIDAQIGAIDTTIKIVEAAKENELLVLRERWREAHAFKKQLLADLFEDKPGHVIELSEDGQYAVQRYEPPQPPFHPYADLYGDANAAYADRARQSAAAYGPLGFPPGVPR